MVEFGGEEVQRGVESLAKQQGEDSGVDFSFVKKKSERPSQQTRSGFISDFRKQAGLDSPDVGTVHTYLNTHKNYNVSYLLSSTTKEVRRELA